MGILVRIGHVFAVRGDGEDRHEQHTRIARHAPYVSDNPLHSLFDCRRHRLDEGWVAQLQVACQEDVVHSDVEDHGLGVLVPELSVPEAPQELVRGVA